MEDKHTIRILHYKDHLMSATEKDGELYFVPDDIGEALGLDIDTLSKAKKLLEDDEKITIYFTKTNEEMGRYTVINEFGVYTLVFQSRNKKEAKEFLHWISREFSWYENRKSR